MESSFTAKDFSIFRMDNDIKRFDQFYLHNHSDKMEILVMYEGDAEFHIEGNVYPLEPNDIVIVQHNELHRVVFRSLCHYSRLVINIDTSFFNDNDCPAFKNVFINRKLGEKNLIKHNHPGAKDILEILERLQKYVSNEKPMLMIIKNTLIELLYILNIKEIKTSESTPKHNNIRKIILYINERITEQLDLEQIAAEFFMSKYHLCHIFKKHTGFTVNQYITRKRIAIVKELCEAGKSLTFAASEAGFKNYSSFYRAYLKETGKNPKFKNKSI